MIIISFGVDPSRGRGPHVVVMILEKENLDRLRESDPFDLQLRTTALPKDCLARDVDFVIAYEEDMDLLMRFQKEQDIAGLMMWLERGRVHQPGDAGPAVPLRKM